MHETMRTITVLAAATLLAVLTTVAAAAVPSVDGAGAPRAAARAPQRTSTRATSFDWMSDVRERLRVLESHSAEAALAHSATIDPGPLGRLYPQLPAAGDGDRP